MSRAKAYATFEDRKACDVVMLLHHDGASALLLRPWVMFSGRSFHEDNTCSRRVFYPLICCCWIIASLYGCIAPPG